MSYQALKPQGTTALGARLLMALVLALSSQNVGVEVHYQLIKSLNELNESPALFEVSYKP